MPPRGLLSDLAAQSRPPDEVFVVDAGSEDGTVGVATVYLLVEVVHAAPPVATGRRWARGARAGR